MQYIKLLGHYYKDGYYGNCSNSTRPIVEDITLGNPGTIRIHSDQGDTLYVYHEALANVPEYIKKIFENGTYTNGAVIYNALDSSDLDYPYMAEIIVIPHTNYCLNGSNEIHYDIYWPYDFERDPIPVTNRGWVYDRIDIPTYPLYTATHDGAHISVVGKTLSASDVYGLTSPIGTIAVGKSDTSFYINGRTISISDIDDRLTRLENQNQTKGKEKENMNNLFGNLRVGKAGSNYSITYFGTVAYKGKTWYNNTVYDCQGMTIDLDLLYLVPTSEINSGDIIEKDGDAYYVVGVADGKLEVVNLVTSKEETLLPGGPFGMILYSKVYNPMGGMGAKDNNIGNMLLMQSLLGNKGGDNSMLVAMMMMQGGFTFPAMRLPEAPAKRK